MAASVGCALAGSMLALIGLRFVQALGGAASTMMTRAVVRDSFGDVDAARVFSLLMLVMGVAPILSPLLGGWMLLVVGWRAVFLVQAAFAFLCLAAVGFALPESLPPERQSRGFVRVLGTYGRLLADRAFMANALAGGFVIAGMFAYIAGSPFVFIEVFGVAPDRYGYLFGANAIGIIGASQIAGLLAPRLDPDRVLRRILWAVAGTGLLLAVDGLTGLGGFPGILVPLFVSVASVGCVMPLSTVLAMTHQGERAGSASALMGTLQFGLGAAAGGLVSLLNDGTPAAMVVVVGGCGLGAVLVRNTRLLVRCGRRRLSGADETPAPSGRFQGRRRADDPRETPEPPRSQRRIAPMRLRHRVLDHVRRRLADEPPPLRIAFWDGDAFDFAPRPPEVTIAIRSPRVLRLFLTGDMGGLGQAYVEGDLAVDGRLQDILRVGITLAERLAGTSTVLRRVVPILSRLLPRRHNRERDAAAIRYHYDVSNEFYRLWLDREMVYSCAYFRTGREDLDTAQEQKLDHLCRKLGLRPGDRLLDIGCGWGGLLRWAAARYGITGVGVTLSEQQYEYARQRSAAEGLADGLEFRLQDYRDIPGEACFDKIVSVGMYEHVGLANLPLYFGTIGRLLREGGAALNHGITAADRNGRAQGPPGGEFIDRFVFPGGELPHLSRVLYEVAGCGLEPVDVEDLRPHYPETLLRWVRRLEAEKARAIEIAGAERYRIWRIYMAGMALAFDRGWLTVCQVLARKPVRGRPAPRPWTRDFQYAQADPVPFAAGLDWGDL